MCDTVASLDALQASSRRSVFCDTSLRLWRLLSEPGHCVRQEIVQGVVPDGGSVSTAQDPPPFVLATGCHLTDTSCLGPCSVVCAGCRMLAEVRLRSALSCPFVTGDYGEIDREPELLTRAVRRFLESELCPVAGGRQLESVTGAAKTRTAERGSERSLHEVGVDTLGSCQAIVVLPGLPEAVLPCLEAAERFRVFWLQRHADSMTRLAIPRRAPNRPAERPTPTPRHPHRTPRPRLLDPRPRPRPHRRQGHLALPAPLGAHARLWKPLPPDPHDPQAPPRPPLA
jgi:hypothetical protein